LAKKSPIRCSFGFVPPNPALSSLSLTISLLGVCRCLCLCSPAKAPQLRDCHSF
jgi:hypothetical protein